ncbi:MAG: MFS transporter [Candidatus Micrarchaeaceae archaeon]
MAKKKKFRGRYLAMFFPALIAMIAYMDRSNIAVAGAQIMPEFHITLVEFGLISSIFFWAYTAMQIPGGIMSERYGPRKTLAGAFGWWSTFTLLTAAGFSYISFLIIRGLFGLGEAPMFPSSGNLYSRWLKKNEMGIANAWLYTGTWIGPLFSTVLSTWIMIMWGWRLIFIIYGIIGAIVAIGYYAVMRDRPEESKYVSKEEIKDINATYAKPEIERGKTTKKWAPWGTLLKNGRFWAFGFTHGAADLMVYALLTMLPLYLLDARHIKLSAMPAFGVVPWIVGIIGVLFFGYYLDSRIKKGTTLRSTYAIPAGIGLVIGGILFVLGGWVVSAVTSIVLIALAMFAITPHEITSFSIEARMGHEYSGTYSGWLNFWGNLFGSFAPLLITAIAATVSWAAAIMTLGVMIIILGALWFVVNPDKSFAPKVIPSYIPMTAAAGE